MNQELPDVQAGFRKGLGTRDQIADIHWIIEKTREFQKNIYFFARGEKKVRSISEKCEISVLNWLMEWDSCHVL